MDIIENPSYENLQETYTKYFSLPVFGTDISEKLALICLVCRLTYLLKQKKPDVTPWTILYKLNQQGNCGVKESWLKGFAIVCSDFGHGCSVFPDFGIENKDIPKKIIEFLNKWMPF